MKGRRSLRVTLAAVLIAGLFFAEAAERAAKAEDVAAGAWVMTAPLNSGRQLHSLTALPDGKVLAAGGQLSGGSDFTTATAELFDPMTGKWHETGSMITARSMHTATLLQSGRILVVGGQEPSAENSAEIYDPAVETWQATPPLPSRHEGNTATLLRDGRVLVAGARGDLVEGGNFLPTGREGTTVDIFDPSTGAWVAANDMHSRREWHSATLLDGPECDTDPPPHCGKVLVVGGDQDGSALYEHVSGTAEMFDPATGTWSIIAPPQFGRARHSATVINGPQCQQVPRPVHCGRVLVAGGSCRACQVAFASAEIYDPAANRWIPASPLRHPRRLHSATLLWDGTVLMAGCDNSYCNPLSTESYDPHKVDGNTGLVGVTTDAASMHQPHTFGATTLLPSGRILVAGGRSGGANDEKRSAEVFVPSSLAPTITSISPSVGFAGTSIEIRGTGFEDVLAVRFGAAQSSFQRVSLTLITATAPPHPDGSVQVVVVTKAGSSAASFSSGFTYGAHWQEHSPLTACSPSSSSCASRYLHTATTLSDGSVLITGGCCDANGLGLSSAQLFDPSSAAWTPTASLAVGRSDHTATLLDGPACAGNSSPQYCGEVLVVGGRATPMLTFYPSQTAPGAERYNPSAKTWTPTLPTASARMTHTATQLADGRILVVGGRNNEDSYLVLPTAEIYDPRTGGWTDAKPMAYARFGHSATLLETGEVLVAGGLGHPVTDCDPAPCPEVPLQSVELYDPLENAWREAAPLAVERFFHTATLLTEGCAGECGKVLAVGGERNGGAKTAAVESFDRTGTTLVDGRHLLGTWSARSNLNVARVGHTATMLESGQLLIAGGRKRPEIFDSTDFEPVATSELYDLIDKTWSAAPTMGMPRGLHATAVLSGGSCRNASPPEYCGAVLATGGLPGGLSAAPLGLTELFAPPAGITGLTPARGPSTGGTPVKIRGGPFSTATAVWFGELAAQSFTVDSSTTITAVSPPHLKGPVVIRVATAHGEVGREGVNPPAVYNFEVSQAPRQVADLGAAAISDTEVLLTFSAPSSDGPFPPPASEYLIRQSSSPIRTESDFDAAAPLCGGKCSFVPGVVGATLKLSVGDLSPGTTYHYALRAVNEVGLVGPLSNAATATTTGVVSGATCVVPALGAGQVMYPKGYSLVGLPEGSLLRADSPLYGWFDKGAGGQYGTQATSEPLRGGHGYWAWFACPRTVDVAGGTTDVQFPLGGYRASMVGNPSGNGPAQVSGHDFAARWDPTLNEGAGGYFVSGYREPQSLEVGTGIWVFAFADTAVRIASAG